MHVFVCVSVIAMVRWRWHRPATCIHFFFTLSDCFLCPSLLLRWCCCGVSVPVCASSRFRFDSSKNYNFTTTYTEYTHTCIHVNWCICVFACGCAWVKCKVRWGKVYAARRSSAAAATAVATAAAAAAVAAKCNRGSVVASYSSVWFLIFSFVDFVMYCNIAVAWTRMPVCVRTFLWVFSALTSFSLSLSLLTLCGTGCLCSNRHVVAVSLSMVTWNTLCYSFLLCHT